MIPYGGDTNGDGTATIPSPGIWRYIVLSNSNNIFEYTIVRYGGYDGGDNPMIYPASASPVIRYNTFEFAYGRGVSFISSPLSTSIHDNNFNNVPYPIFYDGNASSADVTIQNNTIQNVSSKGIYVQEVDNVAIQNNSISSSIQYGETGISVASCQSGTISGNAIAKKDRGIEINNFSPSITNNNLSDLTGYPFVQVNNSFPSLFRQHLYQCKIPCHRCPGIDRHRRLGQRPESRLAVCHYRRQPDPASGQYIIFTSRYCGQISNWG